MKSSDQIQKLDPQGLTWGLVSYVMWGFFPVYWKLLGSVPAPEILAHRMLWSFAFYLLMFIFTSYRQLPSLFRQTKRDWMLSALACALLSVNWGIYIFAVNSGHILEGSLAYFINPILNVAVGVFFFKESFPFVLKLAVLFAALGVGAKIFLSSTFPWISLVLAFTFCLYGITKKMLKIPARTSSVLEGAVGVVPALLAILYFQQQETIPYTSEILFLLIMGGVVTGLPLFLFSFAAQRIPYSIMGMLQFAAPSLQFLVGVFMYNEVFGPKELVSFGLIWIGILFYLSYQVLVLLRNRNAST
ncbi:MAG: EamA family transporter RarD [Pseudobdellovibrionaceae bacterium]